MGRSIAVLMLAGTAAPAFAEGARGQLSVTVNLLPACAVSTRRPVACTAGTHYSVSRSRLPPRTGAPARRETGRDGVPYLTISY